MTGTIATNIIVDRYRFIKRLMGARFSEPQAEAIADGIRKDVSYGDVATKQDVYGIKQDIHRLEQDIQKLETRMTLNMSKMMLGQAALIIACVKLLP